MGYGPLFNKYICVVRPLDYIFNTIVTYLLFWSRRRGICLYVYNRVIAWLIKNGPLHLFLS